MTISEDRYSDEFLTAEATSDLPGLARTAQALLTVPYAARAAVKAEAHYQMNVRGQGWRPSDMLYRVIANFEAGQPFESAIAKGCDPR